MAESYTGEVRDGVVVFEGPAPPLPAGTRVRVEPIELEESTPSLADRLRTVIGSVSGLPADDDTPRQGGQWRGRVRIADDFKTLPEDLADAFGMGPE